MSVTRHHIADGIRAMGVGAGDLLVVHSSLSSFGHVEGGANAAAKALVDAVSPGGTVFVPTFNYGELPYDPTTTRSLTGAITEAFRHLPGVIRSGHPTHSWAGIGPHAADILRRHKDAHAFARGSPLWRLWEHNAWVLLIGCGHESNSTIHVAEELLHLPFLKRTRPASIIRDGGVIGVTVRRPGCSDSFNRIDPPLRARGVVIDGCIGEARLMLMRSRDLVEAACELMRADPGALLCQPGRCVTCDEARAMLT
jgi:aminoglycoside 3-N-acetyltransferase